MASSLADFQGDAIYLDTNVLEEAHSMDVIEQIAKLSQELPPDKQTEVLDFVAFLVARQAPTIWTVEKRQAAVANTMERQAAVANTMGCLTQTRTTSETFARRKAAEKAREERRWKL